MPSAPAERRARARRPRLRHSDHASRCHRRRISLRTMRVAVDRTGVVRRSPDGIRRDRARRFACSPTVSSTPATTSRCSRRAARARRPTLVSPMSEPPDPHELGNPWYDGYHALASYLQVERLRHRARPRRHRRADLRRAAARQPARRAHAARTVDRAEPAALLAARASTCISSRSATRNAPPTSTCPYAGTVHNGIDLVGVHVPRREGTRARLHRARRTPTRDRRKRSRSPAAPACRCT